VKITRENTRIGTPDRSSRFTEDQGKNRENAPPRLHESSVSQWRVDRYSRAIGTRES
jgi:hypothetical protein